MNPAALKDKDLTRLVEKVEIKQGIPKNGGDPYYYLKLTFNGGYSPSRPYYLNQEVLYTLNSIITDNDLNQQMGAPAPQYM